MVRSAPRWFVAIVVIGLILAASHARAQANATALPRPATSMQSLGTTLMPWTVSIIPFANALPIGACQAVQIALLDESGKEEPRNPTGRRGSISDFDWSVGPSDPLTAVRPSDHYRIVANGFRVIHPRHGRAERGEWERCRAGDDSERDDSSDRAELRGEGGIRHGLRYAGLRVALHGLVRSGNRNVPRRPECASGAAPSRGGHHA